MKIAPNTKVAASTFAERAIAFCTLIEKNKQFSSPIFLKQCHWLLSELNVLALSLPEDLDVSETESDFSLNADALFHEMRAKLGKRDIFWVVFNPYSREKPVQASLADAFRDIYLEMKEGLSIYGSGSLQACRDAIWHWRFGHENHWGKHAVEALMALHELQSEGYE